MTRLEHLLVKVSEESCEVAERASKALRFGVREVQPHQQISRTNLQRLVLEFHDLIAAMELVHEELGEPLVLDTRLVEESKAKAEAFLRYSEKYCGTLQP